MFIVRNIMYCKPGQVRGMVDTFKNLSKTLKKIGVKEPMRIMTDVVGERYWTCVVETEVDSIEKWNQRMQESMKDKEVQKVMKDYHTFVENGRREIFQIE